MTDLGYIKVILDRSAKIVDFECTFTGSIYSVEDVLDKNWFDMFIRSTDKIEVMSVFDDLFQGQEKIWKTYKNKIIVGSGHTMTIAFHNQIFERDGKQYVNSIGVEQVLDGDDRLDILAQELAE